MLSMLPCLCKLCPEQRLVFVLLDSEHFHPASASIRQPAFVSQQRTKQPEKTVSCHVLASSATLEACDRRWAYIGQGSGGDWAWFTMDSCPELPCIGVLEDTFDENSTPPCILSHFHPHPEGPRVPITEGPSRCILRAMSSD
jgi:hypothetical protein